MAERAMKKTPMLAAALAALTALTGAAPAAAAEIPAKFRGDWCEFPATVPVEGTTIYLRGRCPEPSIGWMKPYPAPTSKPSRFIASP